MRGPLPNKKSLENFMETFKDRPPKDPIQNLSLIITSLTKNQI